VELIDGLVVTKVSKKPPHILVGKLLFSALPALVVQHERASRRETQLQDQLEDVRRNELVKLLRLSASDGLAIR
jgi:hypothetical protein